MTPTYIYISPEAAIHESVKIGEFSVVHKNVAIGEGCTIGHHVVLHEGIRIGKNVRIDDHAVIGKNPMMAANSATTQLGQFVPTKIGNDCIVGTSAVIYTGSVIHDKVLIADLATIRENVTIGECTIIGRGVAVENFCTIGSYCKLETNVYLTAYSTVGDQCFIAPCVATSNDNFVGRTKERFKYFKGLILKRGGRIGAHATILPGKTIGEDAFVAAGAVVTKDIPPKKIYAGVPAKEIRNVSDDQLLENQ